LRKKKTKKNNFRSFLALLSFAHNPFFQKNKERKRKRRKERTKKKKKMERIFLKNGKEDEKKKRMN